MNNSRQPIFVLSCARSGSTLLRYIIDTHPDIACPPEIHLGMLSERLYQTLLFTHSDDGIDPKKRVPERVRQVINDIMDEYCQQQKKSYWCDKSVTNIDRIQLIADVFPDARYICLYRNCRDVMHSCLEIMKKDPQGAPRAFDWVSYLSGDGGNRTESFIEYWVDKTSSMVAFEARHKEQCFRLKFEELVKGTGNVVQSMFDFLNVPREPELLRNIFLVPHAQGPGDHKIKRTTSIQADAVGKGGCLSLDAVSRVRMEKANALSGMLGYDRF